MAYKKPVILPPILYESAINMEQVFDIFKDIEIIFPKLWIDNYVRGCGDNNFMPHYVFCVLRIHTDWDSEFFPEFFVCLWIFDISHRSDCRVVTIEIHWGEDFISFIKNIRDLDLP